MDAPRFKRWMLFFAYPLNFSAGLTTVGCLTLVIPLQMMGMRLPGESLLWWLHGALSMALIFSYLGFAYWHSE